jgi:3-phosphoshikimate 1-carboxyvinyltransferase
MDATLRIEPARRIAGSVRVPGDKSVSHRYLMLGAIAGGTTRLAHLAPGADVASTRDCLRALGVRIYEPAPQDATIDGHGWAGLREAANALDCGNSGTTMRLLTGLLAGRPINTALTGDASLRRRPMRRVIDPLTAMGARITSSNGRAPLNILGTGLSCGKLATGVASAQVKSAIMLAALSASGTTTVEEPLPTRDHTELAFPLFGLHARTDGLVVTVPGGQTATAPGGSLTVPGDPSSAAVWAAAASALPGSDLLIEDVLLNPRRLGFVRALQALGATVDVMETDRRGGERVGRLRVRHAGHGDCRLEAADVPDLIDELPILAARAALGGSLEVRGAGELRVKESDRIATIVSGLRALGADAEERADGFVVRGARRLSGGAADAAGDHRMVMAFAIAGLGAAGTTVITGADAVAVSYPDFARDLGALAS